jgi:hypothetical protein
MNSKKTVNLIQDFSLKSFDFKIFFYLLFALASFFLTLDWRLSPLYFKGIELPTFKKIYNLWKHSTSEMAASLATSGSICFPIGVDLKMLKF